MRRNGGIKWAVAAAGPWPAANGRKEMFWSLENEEKVLCRLMLAEIEVLYLDGSHA